MFNVDHRSQCKRLLSRRRNRRRSQLVAQLSHGVDKKPSSIIHLFIYCVALKVIRTSFHSTKLNYTEDHLFLVIFSRSVY